MEIFYKYGIVVEIYGIVVLYCIVVESVVESPNSCGFLLQRGPFLQYLASSIAIPISLPILRKLKQVNTIPMWEQQGTNFCETILEKQMPSS